MGLALTPRQAEKMWTWSDDEILAALGNESYQNLKARAKKMGLKTKRLAESLGLTPKQLREGVRQGNRFPRTPGAFDAMCRQLGFEPSEAGEVLGGIYAEDARSKAIDARGSSLAKLVRLEDVYRRIKDPTTRVVADVAIDALWAQLNLLADREG